MIVNSKYVFNAGSVGEPLDGPEASYIIMDPNSGVGEVVYVPHDIEETVLRMRKSNVPQFVIERFKDNADITIKNRSCLC